MFAISQPKNQKCSSRFYTNTDVFSTVVRWVSTEMMYQLENLPMLMEEVTFFVKMTIDLTKERSASPQRWSIPSLCDETKHKHTAVSRKVLQSRKSFPDNSGSYYG